VLVSNFNDSGNLQGTGTTIVQVSPGDGSAKLFAQIDPSALPGPCPGGVGLTTALAVLRSGWVIVGSLPTSNGASATAQAGCLIVVNGSAQAAETISGPIINGPWDMTVRHGKPRAVVRHERLEWHGGGRRRSGERRNGGTHTALNSEHRTPVAGTPVMIGSGLSERTDPSALVIGPTGLGLAADGTLMWRTL